MPECDPRTAPTTKGGRGFFFWNHTLAQCEKLTTEPATFTDLPIDVLGFAVAGDIGGYSLYTDRFGRKVAYPKSPPKEPPSARQVQCRSDFRNAQAAWKALTKQQKKDLEDACRRTAIPVTGQNLYISAILRHDKDSYLTIQRQSKITLPNLPW